MLYYEVLFAINYNDLIIDYNGLLIDYFNFAMILLSIIMVWLLIISSSSKFGKLTYWKIKIKFYNIGIKNGKENSNVFMIYFYFYLIFIHIFKYQMQTHSDEFQIRYHCKTWLFHIDLR